MKQITTGEPAFDWIFPISIGARLLLSAILLAGFVSGAVATETTLAPSPTVACITLTPGRADSIEYPQDLLARKDGGSVQVEMKFRRPDEEPQVKVLNDSAFAGLILAVKEHVSRFRVPCMGANDAPVTLRQDYVFDPNSHGKVMASQFQDEAYDERRSQLACLTHTTPGSVPYYPRFAQNEDQQGSYLVAMHFYAADQPPEIKWLATSRSATLKKALAEFLAGIRLPCLHGPIDAIQLYKFTLDGGERTLLKDMTLKTMVAAARSVPQPAYFDFSSMACPFQLRIDYYQPYRYNGVTELDTTSSARKPFLDWLKKVTLNLSDKENLNVLGEAFVLTVRCGKLDI